MSDDMEAFATRLRAEVKRAGGPKAFAERAEIPLSTLNTYLSGAAEPKIMAVVRIARALGLSVAELLSSVSKDGDTGSQTPLAESQTPADSVEISMLDLVASAGPGYENEQPAELKRLPFSKALLAALGVKPENARFWTAHGDSMLPTIADGAIVLVDISVSQVRDDGVYIVIVGNHLRIKRVARGWDNQLTLISDNQRYPTETLAPHEAEDLRVGGQVKWAGGKV
ncbi:XRE family transcriptional regulator [Bosea sp. 2KB_26]|uniref:XRE family transcriptional regulator n=1 Tax=Bosea sp. 2KB_26 TaxID=3237475 RepID=UPI003F930B3A